MKHLTTVSSANGIKTSTSVSSGRQLSVTFNKINVRTELDGWHSKIILYWESYFFIYLFKRIISSQRSMVTRRFPRSHLIRRPFNSCRVRNSMGDDFIYCVRGFLFCLVFLSLFLLEPCPKHRTRVVVTPYRYCLI